MVVVLVTNWYLDQSALILIRFRVRVRARFRVTRVRVTIRVRVRVRVRPCDNHCQALIMLPSTFL